MILTFAASLALFAASAVQAQTFEFKGTGATGAPGDRVFVELDYFYGDSFEVTTEDLQLRYDASALSFRPEFTNVVRDGVLTTLPDYLRELDLVSKDGFGSTLSNAAPIGLPAEQGGFNLSFTSPFPGHIRSGHVFFNVAFDIASTATDGSYLVSFGDKNVLTDADFSEYGYLQNLQVTVQAAVVPEPEVALMLLPGLALIGLQVRRRRARLNQTA